MHRKIASVYFMDTNGKPKRHKEYYFASLVDDLAEGDLVVVNTRYGFQVVEFLRYVETTSRPYAYVLSKLDIDNFNIQKEIDSKINTLQEKIEKRANTLLISGPDEKLAYLDPSIAVLVNEKKLLLEKI